MIDPARTIPATSRRLLDSPPTILHQVLMRRIGLGVVITLRLLIAPLGSEAQQTYRHVPNSLGRPRDRPAARGRGACRYCNRRIDLVTNDPAPTVRRHTVGRRLLLSRRRHREDWAKSVDPQERVVCPGSGQLPKLRSEDQPVIAPDIKAARKH
jgi:hypothetical protein